MKKNYKINCPNFKSSHMSDASYIYTNNNKPLKHDCTNCLYFSSKNCGLELATPQEYS